MKIIRKPTPHGLRSRLEYRYAGGRYRPVLGYDLTLDQERQEAHRLIAIIHANVAGAVESHQPNGPLFAEFSGEYLKYLRGKQLKDLARPTTILTHHLVPCFGALPLSSIRVAHGLDYLAHRRAAKAAEGTIERECGVLLGLLNYAVATDRLAKNPMSLLPVPAGVKRERVAEPWELWRILRMNSTDVGRMLMLGLLAPLRQEKHVQSHAEWLIERADGWWLMPSPGSTLKRVPKSLPIGRVALSMFHGEHPRLHGRFFPQWTTATSFKPRWIEACERAGIHDLHYHDLRHTALSWLFEAGVDYAVVQKLAGHKVRGMTEQYLHLWDQRLRTAAITLEQVVMLKLTEAMHEERSRAITRPEPKKHGHWAAVGTSWALAKTMEWCKYAEMWCRGTELNCRHQPFQGCALPTELPRHDSRQEERGTVTGSMDKNQVSVDLSSASADGAGCGGEGGI